MDTGLLFAVIYLSFLQQKLPFSVLCPRLINPMLKFGVRAKPAVRRRFKGASQVILSPGGVYILVLHDGSKLMERFDATTHRKKWSEPLDQVPHISRISFSGDGELIAMPTSEPLHLQWNIIDAWTGKKLGTVDFSSTASCVAPRFSADNSIVVAVGRTIESVNWRTGQKADPIALPWHDYCVAISADARTALIDTPALLSTGVSLFNLQKRAATHTLSRPSQASTVYAAEFSSDGSHVALMYNRRQGSPSGRVHIVDVHTGIVLARVLPSTARFYPISRFFLSPDGSVLLTTHGEEGVVRAWDYKEFSDATQPLAVIETGRLNSTVAVEGPYVMVTQVFQSQPYTYSMPCHQVSGGVLTETWRLFLPIGSAASSFEDDMVALADTRCVFGSIRDVL